LLLVKDPPRKILPRLSAADIVFLLGCAILIVPTLIGVARFSWTTEQGGHGPIVLATGIWLLLREIKEAGAPRTTPRPWLPAAGIALFLAIFLVARITGILEIEAIAMYGALLLGIYLLVGGEFMKAIWFPLVYLALVLPPPDTVVAAVTQPIKIAISEWAVALLHTLGYPIASSGVNIYIAQFELLVAAACAGLNSIISLGAICLFYVYLRHRNNFVAFLLVSLAVIPVAIFSNFVRVIVLILITYYMGEAAAQGFLHDFAGLLMFSVALVTIFALDSLYGHIAARRRSPRSVEAHA